MLEFLIEKSTRSDGKLKPSASLCEYLVENFPQFSEYPKPEQAYLALNGEDKRYCSSGNPKFFLSFNKGYRPTCGIAGCACMSTEKRKFNRSELNKKSAKKFQDRTGLSSPSQLPGVGEKISESAKKIGMERSEKIKKTMIDRYGVPSYLSVPGVQSNGAAAAWSDESKTKRKITNVKKYGYPNPAMTPNNIKNSRLCQLIGTNSELQEFWETVNSDDWWAEQSRLTADEYLSRFIRSESTRARYYHINRPDFIDDKISKPHRMVIDYLDSIGVEYVCNVRNIITPYEIDILIPAHSLAIEINGLYWHSESKGKGRNYHVNKTDSCESAGLRLIHFWDYEIVSKWQIAKSIIGQALGVSRRIPARKCVVRPVSSADTRLFLDANHMQGFVGAKFSYGLYHNDELVSLMTFGVPRYSDKQEWELIRFCNAIGTTVIGGAAKLFKHRPQGTMISYSDRRIFTGGLYEILGFTLEGKTKPGYSYTSNYMGLENRHKYQKHKLHDILPNYDPEKTEWENMKMNGYDRVWDCGNTIWTC